MAHIPIYSCCRFVEYEFAQNGPVPRLPAGIIIPEPPKLMFYQRHFDMHAKFTHGPLDSLAHQHLEVHGTPVSHWSVGFAMYYASE